ncbi:MAG: hypothetical protein EZS28_020291 [Streblomastix strix]|uniref:Uncharacterized protein n=1 Tax=Streblomastix strix TaxID=222440 RepID=A0A5J4VNJ4_9EUKA|nr:MAG: hypothetical protein EZS28_020291 [Streblomastix strix]
MARIMLDTQQVQLIELRSETADLKKQADELEKRQPILKDIEHIQQQGEKEKEKESQSPEQEQDENKLQQQISDDLDLSNQNLGIKNIDDRRYKENNELINPKLFSKDNPDYYQKIEQAAQMYSTKDPRYFIHGHLAAVRDIALHPQLMLLTSVSDDGTADLTDVSHAAKPQVSDGTQNQGLRTGSISGSNSQQLQSQSSKSFPQNPSSTSGSTVFSIKLLDPKWHFRPSKKDSIKNLKDATKQQGRPQSNIKFNQYKPLCVKFLPYLESSNDKSRKQQENINSRSSSSSKGSWSQQKRMAIDLGCFVMGDNNGKITVMALPDPKMHMTDTLNKLEKNKMFEFDAHSDAVWSIDESSQTNGVFSGTQIPPTGQKLTQTRIATASADGTVKLWNINTDGISDQTDGNDIIHHKMLQEFKHTPSIASSVVVEWGRQRSQVNDDEMIKIYKPVEQIKDIWEDSDIPSAVIFDPINVANLIVGYVSGDLVRYDIEKGEYNWNQWKENVRFQLASQSIFTSSTYLQFDRLIAAGTNSGKVHIFDLRMGDKGQIGIVGERCEQSFHSPMFSEGITKIAAHPQHPILVTAGADGNITVFSSNPPQSG